MHTRKQVILMKCSEFKKYVVENSAEEIIGTLADEHRRTCKSCDAFCSELEMVSVLVKTLDRKPAPVGFDDRLKSRLAAEKLAEKQKGFSYRLNLAFSIFKDTVMRRYALAPILAALAVFAILFGTNLIPINHGNQAYKSDVTDWAYIKACKNAHASISAEDPFADKSAQLLQSSAFEADQEL